MLPVLPARSIRYLCVKHVILPRHGAASAPAVAHWPGVHCQVCEGNVNGAAVSAAPGFLRWPVWPGAAVCAAGR